MAADALSLDEQAIPHPTKRNRHWLFFQFLMQLVFAVVLRFRARGLEHVPKTGGGLVLINHQSSLDPLLAGVALARPISYVARDSLFSLPMIGWVLRNTYVLPINREAASSRLIKAMVRRLDHGFLVGMFPEGTRSRDGEVGEIKPGFIAMIRRSNVPIYPVGIAGARDAMPRGVLIPRFRPVRVVYGEPLSPEEIKPYLGHGREQELVALVRERIVACQQEAESWRQNSRR
jgi:1-acyl-sn-glycerol-3-phosphate acyltransferase